MTSLPYNGFTGAERARLGAVVYRKIRSGEWSRPQRCEVCGTSDASRLLPHLEDYDDPVRYIGICRRCHLALHSRFSQPERWLKLLDRIDAEGTQANLLDEPAWTVPTWARELLLERIDLRAIRQAEQ